METWSPATKRYVLTLTLIVLIWLLYISRSVLPLVLWAMLLAFVLNPLVTLLTRLYIPRLLATIIIYALFLGALVTLPIIGIPLLVEQIQRAHFDPQQTALHIYEWLFYITTTYMKGKILNQPYDLTPYMDVWLSWLQNGSWLRAIPSTGQIVTALQATLTTTMNVLLGATTTAGFVLMQIAAGIFAFLLTMLYTFYLLLVAPKLRIGLYELFPESYQAEIAYLIDDISHTWRRYLRGQLLLCFTIFLMTWIALSYIGMPGAFTLAVVAGLLEIIPNVGPVLATIPAVIIALLQGSTRFHIPYWQFALLTTGVYAIVQQIENNILVPRVVGSAINVHPFLVLVGVIVGAQVGGILGAVLAAPTLATLRILGHYVHARLLDRPPYPQLLAKEIVQPTPPKISTSKRPVEVELPPSVPTTDQEPTPSPTSHPTVDEVKDQREADVHLPDWLQQQPEVQEEDVR